MCLPWVSIADQKLIKGHTLKLINRSVNVCSNDLFGTNILSLFWHWPDFSWQNFAQKMLVCCWQCCWTIRNAILFACYCNHVANCSDRSKSNSKEHNFGFKTKQYTKVPTTTHQKLLGGSREARSLHVCVDTKLGLIKLKMRKVWNMTKWYKLKMQNVRITF